VFDEAAKLAVKPSTVEFTSIPSAC